MTRNRLRDPVMVALILQLASTEHLLLRKIDYNLKFKNPLRNPVRLAFFLAG